LGLFSSYLEWIGGYSGQLSNLEILSVAGAMTGTIPTEMYVFLEMMRQQQPGGGRCH
jgi:hypothetical protein